MPYWAEKAYLVGNAVFSRVEAEVNDGGEDDESKPAGASPFRFTGKGDSDAFKLIHEHLAELQNRTT